MVLKQRINGNKTKEMEVFWAFFFMETERFYNLKQQWDSSKEKGHKGTSNFKHNRPGNSKNATRNPENKKFGKNQPNPKWIANERPT